MTLFGKDESRIDLMKVRIQKRGGGKCKEGTELSRFEVL